MPLTAVVTGNLTNAVVVGGHHFAKSSVDGRRCDSDGIVGDSEVRQDAPSEGGNVYWRIACFAICPETGFEEMRTQATFDETTLPPSGPLAHFISTGSVLHAAQWDLCERRKKSVHNWLEVIR